MIMFLGLKASIQFLFLLLVHGILIVGTAVLLGVSVSTFLAIKQINILC